MRIKGKKQLKFLTLPILALVLFFALPDITAQAAINQLVSFRGKVSNSDGTSVTGNNYNMSFRLYSAITGGTALWSEDLTAATRFGATIESAAEGADSITYTYSGASNEATLRIGQYLSAGSNSALFATIIGYDTTANTITVTNENSAWAAAETINNRPRVYQSIIEEYLGTVTSLTAVNFNQPLYLEITFNAETLSPRKVITPEAQALNADKLDNLDSTDFLRSTGGGTVSTSSASTTLTVTQNGAGNIVDLYAGASKVFTILANGNVGIGTTTPGTKLDIVQESAASALNINTFTSTSPFYIRRANGTAATPTKTLNGDVLGAISIFGHTGSGYFGGPAARISFSAAADGDAGRNADIIFSTAGTNNLYERMRITTGGNVGIGTTTPTEQLSITGNLQLASTSATGGAIYIGASRFLHTYGTDNTWIGLNTGNLTTTGDNNLGVGENILPLNTSGRYNTAFGNNALPANTSGNYNTAIGGLTLNAHVSGDQNVAIGLQALMSDTSGGENTAVGGLSLNYNLTGGNNTSIGYQSMVRNTSGTLNTALGWHAFSYNTTGGSNTAIGQQTGYTNITGSNNTLVGAVADVATSALTNATAIGYSAIVGASNSLILGGTGANAVNVGIGTTTPNSLLTIHKSSPSANEVLFKVSTSTTPSNAFTIDEDGDVMVLGNMNTLNKLYMGASASASANSDIAIGDSASANGGGSYSALAIGPHSSAVGRSTIAIGNVASADTLYGIALGDGADANGLGSLAIGASSRAEAQTIAIGMGAINSGMLGVALGQASIAGGTYSIALGYDAKAYASNTLVVGSSAGPINNIYFGKGATSTAPTAYTINGTGGDGTDIAGGDLQLAGGRGTGAGLGGSIIFKTAPAGTSGTTLGTLAEKMRIDSTGNVGIGTTTPAGKLHISGTQSSAVLANLVLENLSDSVGAGVGINARFSRYTNTAAAIELRRPSADDDSLIAFKTTADFLTSNATDKMVITGAGNVGIGTTSPIYQTEIHGSGQSVAAITDAGAKGGMLMLRDSESNAAGAGGALLFGGIGVSGTVATPFAGIKGYLQNGTTNTKGDLVFLTRADITDTNLTEVMRVSYTGFVGIGGGYTVSGTPSRMLELNGDAQRVIGLATQSVTNTAGSNLILEAGKATDLATDKSGGNLILKSGVSTGTGGSEIQFYTSPAAVGSGTADNVRAQRMVIDKSGNVGIGTTSPNAKLTVDGGDIRVTGGSFMDDGATLTVPDYVFEDDYQLMGLGDLDYYISINKHLPGLPDMADRAGWSNLSLQDRDMKLLEKIEENTLYIIDHDKKIKTLEEAELTATIDPEGNITTFKAPKLTARDIFALDEEGYLIMDKIKVSELAFKAGANKEENLIGEGIIPAGATSTAILNSKVGESSKIFISQNSDNYASATGQSLNVLKKENGVGFTVSIRQPENFDINFDWWIMSVDEPASLVENPSAEENFSEESAAVFADQPALDEVTLPVPAENTLEPAGEAGEALPVSENAEENSAEAGSEAVNEEIILNENVTPIAGELSPAGSGEENSDSESSATSAPAPTNEENSGDISADI